MNKFLTVISSLAVACATGVAQAETASGAKSIDSKVAMCIGCHGIKGYQASFPEVYKVPMISGQNAKYIVAALTAYKQGERKHPTMRGIAEGLSDKDMADVAAFYEASGKAEGATLPAKAREPNTQVAELVKKAACTSCHGDNFSKPIDAGYPKIAGQHGDYLFAALRSYKTENSSAMGRSNGVMGAIAKQFSNNELKALASYVASLDSDLKTIPESRFR